ncbi:MAG: substrate-binding domain-containing protein [Chloroflexota bacterium]
MKLRQNRSHLYSLFVLVMLFSLIFGACAPVQDTGGIGEAAVEESAEMAAESEGLSLPLMALEDDGDRDHWLIEQVNVPGALEALQEATGSEAVPYSGSQDAPIQIALIYPSADVSDFWARNYLALTKRLDQLGIQYETTEFASRQIEHELQSTYATQVAQDADLYDYVIFGPSELATQADNIDKLAGTPDFVTYVWAFHTPLQYLENQPAVWFDFSSAYGAQVICDYMLERLGSDVTFAANRGIPGITDNQRSGDFIDCVTEKGNWALAYEHYGEYQREGGFDGTNLILQGYPEATVIHNANTAMSMGSVEAQVAAGVEKEIFSTGWGGTGLELEAIRAGQLDATPMRMGDDVGAATAEAIKADLEGRSDELPLVFLGRITVAHDELSLEEIDALEQEAFRFSGVDALDR